MKNKTLMSDFKRPPILSGYFFSPEQARKARDNGNLLALRIETSLQCNLKCRYICRYRSMIWLRIGSSSSG